MRNGAPPPSHALMTHLTRRFRADSALHLTMMMMETKNSALQYFLHFSAAVIVMVECQFLTVPSTTVSYLNTQVQFTCGVEAPWLLTWEVDSIQARHLGWRSISFSTVTTREDETSTLYITATLANNNSEISCISITTNGQEVGRATAFLHIQGLLDPPVNISIVSHSYSSIHLEWTPPFSLQITGNLNNTMYFMVSIIHKLTGKELYEMTVQPEYVYYRHDYEHCSGVVFKIAAVNLVGRGDFSEGFEAGFAGPSVAVNPLNQTVAAGDWATFSCQILCSQNELITWFVNSSPLPSLESEEGAKFQKSPDYVHSHCNNLLFPNVNNTTHMLSVQFDHSLDSQLSVYCAVVSLCDLTTVTPNCTPSMCFSDVAYLEVTTPRVIEPTSNQPRVTSFRAEMTSTNFKTTPFNGTQSNINSHQLQTFYAIGSVIVSGAFLLIIVFILIIIWHCKLHHQRARNREISTQEEHHIYDQIPINVQLSFDKVQNENLEPAEMMDKAQPQVPAAGVEMNPCLAYQIISPCK